MWIPSHFKGLMCVMHPFQVFFNKMSLKRQGTRLFIDMTLKTQTIDERQLLYGLLLIQYNFFKFGGPNIQA